MEFLFPLQDLMPKTLQKRNTILVDPSFEKPCFYGDSISIRKSIIMHDKMQLGMAY